MVPNSKLVGKWLLGCAGLVAGALTVGGLVRLTGSSLSMTSFELFSQMIPPLRQSTWEAEFNRYKHYPDYQLKLEQKAGEMTLTQFKFYYLMEYMHRMGGRLIGLAFFLPASYFLYKGHIAGRSLKIQLALAGSLIILQGFGGWYMVKTGLDPSHNPTDPGHPRVNQYFQAAHLGSALTVYSIFLWNSLSLLLPAYNVLKSSEVTHGHLSSISTLRKIVPLAMALVFCTAIMGSFVSGTDSGKIMNTWPKYDGKWIPDNLFPLEPFWRNFFENKPTIQFIHRNLAYLTFITIAITFLVGRKSHLGSRAKIALYGMAAFGTFQASSGILTLLFSVPIWLASIHQNEALGLYTCLLWLANELRRIPK